MKLATKLGMTPQDYILMIEAGFALLTAGRTGEAVDIFYGCCEMLPESEIPYIGIARCFAADGKMLRAEEWARKALRARFRSPIARLNLAELLLMQGKKKESLRILNLLRDEDMESQEREWKRALLEILGEEPIVKNKINKR